MTIRLSTGLRNALVGTGGGLATVFANGIIEIYSGAQPASADAAPTGTLLGTVTTNAGAFTPGVATNGLTWAAAANGTVTKSASNWQFNGVAAGTAGWFRLKGNALDNNTLSTTLPRLDGSIANSGGDMNLSNTTIAVASPNTVDVFSVTLPAA
jgi:hypothetical protein